MQFTAVALLALLSAATAQKYDIKLYEHRGCLLFHGHKCSDISKDECCHDDDEEYKSGKVEAAGGGKVTDMLKLYKEEDCGGLAIAQETDSKCASAEEKEVKGAKVFIVINPRGDLERPSGPLRIRKPDSSFLEHEGYTYTIKRNTSEGQAFAMLDHPEDMLYHMKRWGVREKMADAN